MTYSEFEQRVKDVEGCCELCGDKQDLSLHVDHCHNSSEYRGLLCGPCNKGLGQFRDNVEVMRKAITYLERSNG